MAALPAAHVTLSSPKADTVLVRALRTAFEQACGETTRLSTAVETMEGMSGRRYRRFANHLVASVPQAGYLEVGSWTGSTLCAAIHGNRVRAFAIDNWSMFGGPVQDFLRNVADCDSADVDFNMLTEDFRRVDFSRLGRFNIYLFDGPHSRDDQYDGLVIAQPALAEEFVLMVDDWNWSQVRQGTFDAVRDLGLTVQQGIEVRTTLDDSHPECARQHSDWHNGYWLAVLKKRAG
ncbi:MAG: hypothetical protein V4709_03745 [Pseudomonadota bacterium]